MNRVLRLRKQLNWPQHRLAAWLGLAQPTVAGMERGAPESGPVSRLLDLLEADLAAGRAPTPIEPASPPAAPSLAAEPDAAGGAPESRSAPAASLSSPRQDDLVSEAP